MMTSSMDFSRNLIQDIATASLSTNYDWTELQEQIISQLQQLPNEVASEYSEDIESCVRLTKYLLQTPFTIQRICELLLMLPLNDSSSQYNSYKKLFYALHKCLNVSAPCTDSKLLGFSSEMDTL